MKDSFEGVAMLPNDGYLASLCKKHGVSVRAKNELEMSARALRFFYEQDQIDRTRNSEKKRSQSLLKVEQLASKLKNAIEDLHENDLAALECEYFFTQYRNLDKLHKCDSIGFNYRNLSNVESLENLETSGQKSESLGDIGRFFEVHSLSRIEVPAIKEASRTARAKLSNVGKNGRPSTSAHQSSCFISIAESLEEANIKPRKTGPFYEFCIAIFEAAGLELPKRAFDHFMMGIRPI